ncbi:MAG TPA: helix-turn-helix domain-containing protein [Syntrophales bacterium]|nr:helix-turn-helix domain-containing protein [Syntrophales bacterium]
MSESFYSTSEVAKLFEINRVTIYRWVQEGVVKAYKVGKHLKIPVSEVDRLWREFGFPDAPCRYISNNAQRNQLQETGNIRAKYKKQRKLVIAVGSDKDNLEFIREIFTNRRLGEECELVMYEDTLEAALAIGKEKPALLLIKIMKSDGSDVEFARKIRSIHSDINIIFISDSYVGGGVDEKKGYGIFDKESRVVGRAELYQKIVKALGLHGRE